VGVCLRCVSESSSCWPSGFGARVDRQQPKTAANARLFVQPVRRCQPLVSSIHEFVCRSHSRLHASSGTLTMGWHLSLHGPLYDGQNSNWKEWPSLSTTETTAKDFCNAVRACAQPGQRQSGIHSHVVGGGAHGGDSQHLYLPLSCRISFRRDKRDGMLAITK
jgi:hypothetical protein